MAITKTTTKQKMTSIGKNMEESELCSIASGIIKRCRCNHHGKYYGGGAEFLIKLNTALPDDPAIPFLGTY
jgi:hypothetical protein